VKLEVDSYGCPATLIRAPAVGLDRVTLVSLYDWFRPSRFRNCSVRESLFFDNYTVYQHEILISGCTRIRGDIDASDSCLREIKVDLSVLNALQGVKEISVD